MLLLGLALMYGSYKCVSTGIEIRQDNVQRIEQYGGNDVSPRIRRRRTGSGAGIFFMGAALLGAPGAAFSFFSLMPTSLMEKFVPTA